MNNLLQRIGLICLAMWTWFVGVLQGARAIAGIYIRILGRFASLAILVPIPFAFLGIVTGWSWLTAWAGVWSFFFFCLTFVWGIPIGILLDGLIRGKKATEAEPEGWISRKRYISAVREVLIWESFLFLFLATFPVRHHWTAIPLCILGIAFLVTSGIQWERPSKWVKPLLRYYVIAVVIWCIASFVFPELIDAAGGLKWFKGKLVKEVDRGWTMFSDFTPLPFLSILAVIGLLIGGPILWRKWRGSAMASAGGGGGQGVSGNRNGLKTAIVWLLILSVPVVLYGLWSANRTAQAVQTSTVTGRYGVWIQQGFRQTVVTPENWEFITVPKHAVLETVLFEPEDCIWIQRGSEPARMRCGSREFTQTEYPVKKDAYTTIIRPAGSKEVRFLYRLTRI